MTAVAPALDPRLRTWRVRVFAATWLSYACYYFCRKPFYIGKSALAEEFAIDASILGSIGFAYLLAYTIGQFVSGWAGDKYGPRLLLLVGMGVSVGCNLVFGFANSWQAIAAFMFLNGLAQSTGWSGNVGSMASWFHRHERGTVMGLWATNFQVGGVLANMVTAFALGAWGWRWSFFVGSAVLSFAWLFLLFNQRNRPEDVGLPPVVSPEGPIEDHDELGKPITEEVEPGRDTAAWTRDTRINVGILGVFYFFIKFIRYAIWSWVPYVLYYSFEMSKSDAGYLSTVFDAAGIASVILLGVLSDRYFNGRRAGISFVFIVGLAVSCVLLYAFGSTSLIMFTVCIGLVGFSLYGPDAILTSAGAIDVGSKQKATLAAGIINGMGSVGAMAQELVVGRMLTVEEGAALDETAIVAVFGALLLSAVLAGGSLGLLLRRNRQGRADM